MATGSHLNNYTSFPLPGIKSFSGKMTSSLPSSNTVSLVKINMECQLYYEATLLIVEWPLTGTVSGQGRFWVHYKFLLGSTDLSCPVYMQFDLCRDQEILGYYKTLIPEAYETYLWHMMLTSCVGMGWGTTK